MSWESVTLIPGLNTQLTQTLRQAGYTATEKGRFSNGLFQKMGGWTKYYNGVLPGTCRKLHVYQDLDGDDHVVIGGESSLQDLASSILLNITPQQTETSIGLGTTDGEGFSTASGSATITVVDVSIGTVSSFSSVTFLTPVVIGGLLLQGTYQIASYVSATSYTIEADNNATSTVTNGGELPTLTTISGSSAITVGLTAHGLSEGDEIIFDTSETIGGVTLTGRYVVQDVPTADTFTLTANTAASSSAGPTSINSGEAALRYHITIGPQATGGAYGAGLYGAGTYGVGASLNVTSGTDITATDWSLDNWGELLLACPEDGGIYWWGQNTGYKNVQLISDAPIYNTGMFISISEQVVIAYGSSTTAAIGTYLDPLLIRWCETGDFFTWSELATYRIPTGSKCVGGVATAQRNIIWTDLDIWSMDYIGSSLGYGFNKIGSNCGLIAKHAHAQLAGALYWMGASNFYVMNADGIAVLPCPVWDAVFQNLDHDYAKFCHAGANSSFSEVIFLYPSASNSFGYCDKYAKFNTLTGEWDTGNLQRNSWIDKTILEYPIAMSNSGVIYSHESGNNADNSAITSSFTTGFFTVGEGEGVMFVDRIYPDFKWGEYGGNDTAQIQITVHTAKYPGDTQVDYGPFTLTKDKQFISKRMRARHMAFTIESSDSDSWWRLGKVRIRITADGKR